MANVWERWHPLSRTMRVLVFVNLLALIGCTPESNAAIAERIAHPSPAALYYSNPNNFAAPQPSLPQMRVCLPAGPMMQVCQ